MGQSDRGQPEQPLATMRVEYGSREKDGSSDLDTDWLGPDAAAGWVGLLRAWITDAQRAGLAEPNAMVVATVDRSDDPAGRPAARTVLCKAVDVAGVTFYTNYGSAKGDDLAATPYACATFGWYGLGRQVHLRGPVEKVSRGETEAYFAQRPRGSQLGAWASLQSRPVPSRTALLAQLDEVSRRFADSDVVPAPPDWGGMRIAADTVEFWQGRENRMHNRIRVHPGDGRVERLQP